MNENNTPKKYTWYKFGNIYAGVADVLEAIFAAVVIAIVLLTLVFRMGYVEGTSMLPTMEPGERYILSSVLYDPKQGDVVVFAPDSTVKTDEPLWVKRVIATEGQEVYINPDDNCVYVDGIKLDESYLAPFTVTLARATPNPITVPKGCVYLMGDNRGMSRDGRDIGCVDVRRLIGKVIYKLPF
jgi:signal peptidase I